MALGASNLTLGLETAASLARATWDAELEVFAAVGYGRSYGIPSFFAFRTLPGIVECGLWDALRRSPPARTRALVADVGNDILYGMTPEKILAWVETAASRLADAEAEIVIAGLPLERMRRLSSPAFLFFRTLFYPPCRLSLETVMARAEAVNEGLAEIASRFHARFVRLNPEWYGPDPIHIRPDRWRDAWPAILLGHEARAPFSLVEWLQFHASPAERQAFFGLARRTPQLGAALRGGGRLWMF